MEPDDFDNESPAERMKRIQRTMRAPDVGIESAAQSKSVPGVGMGYSGVLGGSRGPLSAMGAVASNPRTDGVGALVGRGALQAGPVEFSYQRVQPAMRGARGENTVGLGGRPFDPDTYFGVQASQGPGGRGYGVNVGRDGFSLSGQYNPARRDLTGSLDYRRQFAGGGPVMPSFDPMGGFTGMEGVEQQGRAPGAYETMADRVAGAGASVGEPIRQAAKGLSDIPGTVGGYFADVSAGPDPSQRLGEDIRKFGSMFVDEATKGPVEFAKTVGSFLPGIGEAISAYDANDLYDQVKKAEAEGDMKKAASLRQIYGMAAAGAMPGVGMAARLARRMKGAETAAEGAAEAGVRQSISSADTSLNQVPALFKSSAFDAPEGSRNLDIGGGKYDKGTEYLAAEKGVDSYVYDPFNRSAEHNKSVLDEFSGNPADTVTAANVLNVIKEPEARLDVIQRAFDNLKPGGKAYFDIYEGNKSGVGKETTKGWQNNMKAAEFEDEIRSVFPEVNRKGTMLIATKPLDEAAGAAEDVAKAADVGADHPAMINTRYPTGKKRIEEVEGERLVADLAAMKATPEMFENNVNLVKDYVNMPESLRAGTPDEVAENFINHVKDNLIYLHDQVPENIRSRSQLWYDGARVITDDWAKEYGVPDSAVAGALAALSPQKDWYQNVSLAKRVLDVVKGGGDNFYNGFAFSPEMQKTYESIASLNKPEYTSLFDQIKGRSLGDISKLDLPDDEKAILKAMWTRLYDEAHNSKAYPIVTPEGGFGDMVKTSKGEDARVAWGSMNEIAKAIRAVEGNGDPALLNDIMGGKHKVRNFYNNILAPNSSRGDVTIDTHAVAAGLLRPLSQKSVEVAHNFKTSAPKGLPGASGSAASGIQGTYPLYAEAYRRAAQERGILPRQMQSITWEAVRGLFPDTFKTPKNMAAVDALWDRYRAGEASLDETRKAINDLAGGVNPPTWFRPAGAADESVQGAGDAGVVSGSGVSGNAAGGSVSRARGGLAKEPSKESVGYAKGGSASKQDAIERAIMSFRDVAEEHGVYRPQLTNIILKATPNMPRDRAALFAKNILSEDLLDLSERLVGNPKAIPLLKGLEAQIKKGKTDSLVGELRQALRARAINGE
jgi:hypothetical protein